MCKAAPWLDPQTNRQMCSEPNSASCDLECEGRFPQVCSTSLPIDFVASMGMHAHMVFAGRCELTVPWFQSTGNHLSGVYMGKKIHQKEQRRQPCLGNIWLLQSISKTELTTACLTTWRNTPRIKKNHLGTAKFCKIQLPILLEFWLLSVFNRTKNYAVLGRPHCMKYLPVPGGDGPEQAQQMSLDSSSESENYACFPTLSLSGTVAQLC